MATVPETGFTPVGPRRTFEGAVEQIAERIRLGELSAGDRLPSERELAAAMQISRRASRTPATSSRRRSDFDRSSSIGT